MFLCIACDHKGDADFVGAGNILTKTLVALADHRAAMDWLNTNTAEEFSFFGVEIELWRIGDSPRALLVST
jgi:hypothetical protein